ncbi:MAG: GDSL-type esterase/lipase family protein [Pseudomonadales bacterium]
MHYTTKPQSTLRRTLSRVLLSLSVVTLSLGYPLLASADSKHQGHHGYKPGHQPSWVASWATASKTITPFDAPLPTLNDVTLRQIVRVSLGGRGVRVWLTNEFGVAPLEVQAATVALQEHRDAIDPKTKRTLRFGGKTSVTIAPGAKVLSDPVRLRVPDLADVAISLYLPQDLTTTADTTSYHVRALQTSYIAQGDQTAEYDLSGEATTVSWFFLAGLDVVTHGRPIVVAGYGDSITDGDQLAAMEPVDENARYTNFLAKKLLRQGRAAVINLGISGNQVTNTFLGENMQARLDRDIFAQTGVTHLVVLGGINDMGLPVLLGAPAGTPAATIIAGHQQIAARARAQGLIVLGGTITPSGSVPLPGYNSAETQAIRAEVNHWIRTTRAYDHVVDFDKVLRDPKDPGVMRADLTADGLHPNTQGYRAMAKAVAKVLRRGHNKRW